MSKIVEIPARRCGESFEESSMTISLRGPLTTRFSKSPPRQDIWIDLGDQEVIVSAKDLRIAVVSMVATPL